MSSRLVRLTLGVAICAVSIVVLAGPIYLAGMLVFARSLSINFDGRSLAIVLALAMFGGAGGVAGIWTLWPAIWHHPKQK